MPPALALAAPGWHAVVLVKPQFEARRGEAGRGVVRDAEVQRRVLREVAEGALEWSGATVGVVDSGLPGPKGNREFFLHLVQREGATRPDELDTGSTPPSAEPPRSVTVIAHGRRGTVGDALDRLRALAKESDVELVEPDAHPDLAVVLGGDGTMLRALKHFLGTDTPVVGVNYGSVGFLTSIRADELQKGLSRVFAGDYVVVELRTLEVEAGDEAHVAVNDVVLRSAVLGRMIQLSWQLGGEDLGRVPCDGVICATPAGSTAYNLSNGGPVLVWGLEAMAVSFLAPHSLHVRPLVVPRGLDLRLTNETPDVSASLLVDGRRGEPGESACLRVDDQATRLRSAESTSALASPISWPKGTFRRLRLRRPAYHCRVLRRLRIENLVLIRDAELELDPGLNAITGETGAGKTILAQAVGLLLGTKGDAAAVAPGAAEAYVEAELDLPDGLLEEEGLEALAELRPEGEDWLVLARRVTSEGRTRAYAWGRASRARTSPRWRSG